MHMQMPHIIVNWEAESPGKKQKHSSPSWLVPCDTLPLCRTQSHSSLSLQTWRPCVQAQALVGNVFHPNDKGINPGKYLLLLPLPSVLQLTFCCPQSLSLAFKNDICFCCLITPSKSRHICSGHEPASNGLKLSVYIHR